MAKYNTAVTPVHKQLSNRSIIVGQWYVIISLIFYYVLLHHEGLIQKRITGPHGSHVGAIVQSTDFVDFFVLSPSYTVVN